MRERSDRALQAAPKQRTDLRAVLCDMDGTLVDTEGRWTEAVESVAAALGITLTGTQLAELAGHSVAHTSAYLRRMGAPESAALDDLLADALHDRVSGTVQWRPGARLLLDRLGERGVPLALVTASPRRVADTVLASIGVSRFAVTVAAEDAPRSKPHPDPYLMAMARLGVTAPGCVAIEDTPTGVAAAQAAGCAVVAVPSVVGIPPAPARLVVATLELITPDVLASFAGNPGAMVQASSF